jgi:hypothetical protein
MGGRTVLTFSDSRQDAAFFAPYFEDTANDLALRTAAFQALRKHKGDWLDFQDLADEVLKDWRRTGLPVLPNNSGGLLINRDRQSERVTALLMAEFCTPGGRRNSLEALGCVHVDYKEGAFEQFVRQLQPAVPERHKSEAAELAHILLESVRREKAIKTIRDIDLTDSDIWGDQYSNRRSFECIRSGQNGVSHAWMPSADSTRHNRRTWYLKEQLGWSWEETRAFLDVAWQAMRTARLLVPLQPGFGLDASNILLAFAQGIPLQCCSHCGIMVFHSVAGKCPAFRCRGDMRLLRDDERTAMERENHYVATFLAGRSTTLRAREHTAALSTELRQQIEEEFSNKEVNLLSCTTTMELGVDLGELDAVVCLNIPPDVSNYQQRTGRAGRRAQAAPICVTLAKSGRYDQSVFPEFQEFLRRPASLPRLHLGNAQLFQRHQFSILLSGFLRHRIAGRDFNAPLLKHFFGERFSNQEYGQFRADLRSWLRTSDGRACISEAERLVGLLPDEVGIVVALTGSKLEEGFIEALDRFALHVVERWEIYEKKRQDYRNAENDRMAAHWQRLSEDFMNQYLVDKLSLHGLIPTYSFPVHTISLEVIRERQQQAGRQSAEVALVRDASLGLSEYAPGSQVVANGRIWTSRGIAYTPRRFMPERYFRVCRECNHVQIADERDGVSGSCPFCDAPSHGPVSRFIEPACFVTGYADRRGAHPGRSRRRRQYAEEARLISLAREEDFKATDHPVIRRALLRSQEQGGAEAGRLFVVNKGPRGLGFHRCLRCNHMEPAQRRETAVVRHRDILSGEPCNQLLDFPLCLAHIFKTDVAIYRFFIPLPERSHAWTLSEAMRFGAAGLLGVQDGELNASFKLGSQSVDVILYDAVAGGAGYVTALHEQPVKELLRGSISKLDCRANCTKACRACLCDYSNQRRWDIFDRVPVRDWLHAVLMA